MIQFRNIHAPDCLLGENPVWYEPASEFLWTDIMRGVIYAYSPESGEVRTVLKTPFQTGAFLIEEQGCLVLFTEKGVMYAKKTNGGFSLDTTPLWTVPFDEGERFNDAIADPEGRMISGAKRTDNTRGRLYRFAPGREPEVLLEGLDISNGMGFSPDGHTFYHTDSVPSVITAYDYTPDEPLRNARTVVRLDTQYDPDGMTVDYEGNLWTACWGAGIILKLSPEGTQLGLSPIGVPQCTSLCFGGGELCDLLVTSASVGSAEAGKSLGGSVFYAHQADRGKPELLAKIR